MEVSASSPTKDETSSVGNNRLGASDLLEMRYIPLATAVLWDENPKEHHIGGLIESIKRYGFKDAPIHDATKGCVIAGNGRIIALKMMKDDGEDPPRGVAVNGDGDWFVPIQFGVDASTPEEAEAFGIDHNNLTIIGGNVSMDAVMAIWRERELKGVLDRVSKVTEMPVSVDWEDYSSMRGSGDGAQPDLVPSGSPANTEGDRILALSTVLGNPRNTVKSGDVFVLNGRHVLVVACPIEEHSIWLPHMLNEDRPVDLFCPYPGPFVPLSEEAKIKSLLLVQPDTFIAGHILDNYESVNGRTSIVSTV